jgi:hypothetical protein
MRHSRGREWWAELTTNDQLGSKTREDVTYGGMVGGGAPGANVGGGIGKPGGKFENGGLEKGGGAPP